MKKTYEFPVLEEEKIMIEDVIAQSLFGDRPGDTPGNFWDIPTVQ